MSVEYNYISTIKIQHKYSTKESSTSNQTCEEIQSIRRIKNKRQELFNMSEIIWYCCDDCPFETYEAQDAEQHQVKTDHSFSRFRT